MRVSLKILFVILLVAVLPVAVSGLTSVLLARGAVATASSEVLEAEARHLAEVSETTILGAVNDLQRAALLGLDKMSPGDLTESLNIIYRGDAARNAVVLVDGASAKQVVDTVRRDNADKWDGLSEHEAFPPTALDAFAQHIPFEGALATGKGVGVPYADPARGTPLIAVAVRVAGPPDKDGKPHPWIVAAELSLRALNKRFAEAKDDKLVAYLVDFDGRVVCHSDARLALERFDLSRTAGVKQMFDPKAPDSAVVGVNDTTNPTLTAYSRVSRLAAPNGRMYGVVVERNRAEALSLVDGLTTRTAFWVGTALIMALIAGTVLARGIARPIEVLTSIVQRFAAAGGGGDASLRAPAIGRDEIGTLGEAFNKMADDIDDYTRQLKSFNTELQKKVEDRTRELKDAQNQLIQSQKMAAVGELGAGVAHEINNPLAGVLGSAQLALLRLDDKESRVKPHLQDIEREALRIKDIVDSLLKLSQDQGSLTMSTVDINQVVEGAVALLARPIIAQRIQVKKELGKDLPRVRGRSADLQNALMQLLTNAKDAMPDGGTLTVRTEAIDDRLVKISVEDTGHGLGEGMKERIFEPFFTTRASKGHKGMGLAIVHRVVDEHQGRVTVDSAPGKGASFRIVFPATRESLHLV